MGTNSRNQLTGEFEFNPLGPELRIRQVSSAIILLFSSGGAIRDTSFLTGKVLSRLKREVN